MNGLLSKRVIARDPGGRFAYTGGRKKIVPSQRAWASPPRPRGGKIRRRLGYSASGKTNTALGDLAERITTRFGLTSLLHGRRQNPLDAVWKPGRLGFEIKAVTTASKQYKIGMKAHERREKYVYARRNGLKPASMMVVMDVRRHTAWTYWRLGISSTRLNQKNWSYLGTVKF